MKEARDRERQALVRAAELVGGQAALASACGYPDRRHVWPWFNTDRRVPVEKCPAIERATGGAVRCEDLRPDVAWEVLRNSPASELINADGAPDVAEPAAAEPVRAEG